MIIQLSDIAAKACHFVELWFYLLRQIGGLPDFPGSSRREPHLLYMASEDKYIVLPFLKSGFFHKTWKNFQLFA